MNKIPVFKLQCDFVAIVVIILFIGCCEGPPVRESRIYKKESHASQEPKISYNKETHGTQEPKTSERDSLMKALRGQYRYSQIKSVGTGPYRLDMHTHFLNDTLYISHWASYPIIEAQELKFYGGNRLIKTRPLAIEITAMRTVSGKYVKVPAMPMFSIELLKGGLGDYFYIVSGQGYCSFGNCPEFIGVYTLEGKIIHESISTQGSVSKDYMSLAEFCEKYKLERLNNGIQEEFLLPSDNY